MSTKQYYTHALPVIISLQVYTVKVPRGYYAANRKRIHKGLVVFIGINGEENFFNVELSGKKGCIMQFEFSQIGKDVFMTYEEAEAAADKLHIC